MLGIKRALWSQAPASKFFWYLPRFNQLSWLISKIWYFSSFSFCKIFAHIIVWSVPERFEPFEVIRVLNITKLFVISPCFIMIVLDSWWAAALVHQKLIRPFLGPFPSNCFEVFMANEPLGVIFIRAASGLLDSDLFLVLIDVVHIIKLLDLKITPYVSPFHYTLPSYSKSNLSCPPIPAASFLSER